MGTTGKDRVSAPEFDELCAYRKCYNLGEDKGTYTPGRGYTSYYKNPIKCCMTRLCHGCPSSNISTLDQRSIRRIPDVERLKDLKDEINKSKCTKKVKVLMDRMIKIIMLQMEYIEAADARLDPDKLC